VPNCGVAHVELPGPPTAAVVTHQIIRWSVPAGCSLCLQQ
jgi:hypothetical protein